MYMYIMDRIGEKPFHVNDGSSGLIPADSDSVGLPKQYGLLVVSPLACHRHLCSPGLKPGIGMW